MEKEDNNRTDLKETEKKAQLNKAWTLLLMDPLELNDDELNLLLEAKDELESHLQSLSMSFPRNVERALRHHEKKRKLSQLSTEELEEMDREFREANAAYFRSISEREEAGEEIGDSAFESPSIDSNEHIVYELLKERKAEKPAPVK